MKHLKKEQIKNPTSLDDLAYNSAVEFNVVGEHSASEHYIAPSEDITEDKTNISVAQFDKKLYDAVLFYANADNWELAPDGTRVVIKGDKFSKALHDRGHKARVALGLPEEKLQELFTTETIQKKSLWQRLIDWTT